MSTRTTAAVSILLLLAGPGIAFAQTISDDPAVLDRQQHKKDAEELDKRYNSTLKSTDQGQTAARVDPWQNMRGPNDPKTKH